MILEGVITTIDSHGEVNVAPMGPRVLEDDMERFLLRPFKTSRTYQNLKHVPEGVFHITDDVELIARSVLGSVTPTLRPATAVRGRILTDACRAFEFRVEEIDDREERTSILARTVARSTLRDFSGFNRAKHAVVEAAILASRIGILPLHEIRDELARLAVIVEKTAGEQERRAFGHIERHVAMCRSSSGVSVRTGSRLHLGLLAPLASESARLHGGVGMMVEEPSIKVTATRSNDRIDTEVSGDLAHRARAILDELDDASLRPRPGTRIHIESSAREHAGLGVGTQLSLAIAGALDALHGNRRDAVELARASGRGRRSAIGIHGFQLGGFLVDGGHPPERDASRGSIAPLVARLEIPECWRVILATPRDQSGLSGPREIEAFRLLDAGARARPNDRRGAELCHAVLLDLLPNLAERDFARFSAALGELQRRVGETFAPAQGGIFASSEGRTLASFFRAEGLAGVGQSSWGPTVFAFVQDEERGETIARRARERFGLGEVEVTLTRARNRGAERD